MPFRTYLGAILSAIEGHPVAPSICNSNVELDLDVIDEEDEGGDNDQDHSNEDDDLKTYHGTPPTRGTLSITCASCGRGCGHAHPCNESELMVCPLFCPHLSSFSLAQLSDYFI